MIKNKPDVNWLWTNLKLGLLAVHHFYASNRVHLDCMKCLWAAKMLTIAVPWQIQWKFDSRRLLPRRNSSIEHLVVRLLERLKRRTDRIFKKKNLRKLAKINCSTFDAVCFETWETISQPLNWRLPQATKNSAHLNKNSWFKSN